MTLNKFLEDGEKRFNIDSDTSEPGLRFNEITKVSHLPFYGLFQMSAFYILLIISILTFCKQMLIISVSA